MYRTGICIAGAIMLSGCVSNVAPLASTKIAYVGKPLTIVTHEAPSLGVLTWHPAEIIAGAVVLGVRGEDGDQIVQEDALKDPALTIADQLGLTVSKHLGTSDTRRVAVSSDAMASLAGKNSRGVVLDVKSRAWQVLYYSFDKTHYRTMYRGQASLIDAGTDRVVSQAPCAWDSDDNNRPTYDELFANKGALLKSELADAATFCTAVYEKALLPD